MAHDFDYGILDVTRHRPWPMPSRPWLMTQTWSDLLFAHWPVDAAALRRVVPEPLELDAFDGTCWLGIVPFRMSNVAPRGVPAIPGLSAFPEMNVRTYVRVGNRPGIYFFSLDAGSTPAVLAARLLLNLPYFTAAMRVDRHDDVVHYESRRVRRGREAVGRDARAEAVLAGTYRPVGPVFHATRGSLVHFLTERYCLYNLDRRGRPYRLEIHHPAWPLQAANATFERNTMAAAAGLTLPTTTAPLLHFAQRVDMVAWYPSPVG